MRAATSERSFTVTCELDSSPDEVFSSITDVERWWTGSVTGSASQVGDEFTYTFGDLHESRQRVTELIPGSKVAWEVTDARLAGRKALDEWRGTHIIFELAPTESGTRVEFTHLGLMPELECYEDCAYAWTFFLDGSLRALIATGEGPTAPPWA